MKYLHGVSDMESLGSKLLFRFRSEKGVNEEL